MAKINVGGGFVVETFSVLPATSRKKRTAGSRSASGLSATTKSYRLVAPTFSPRRIRDKRGKSVLSDHAARVSDTWSGGVTAPPPGQQITSVQGCWTIPTVALPANAAQDRLYAASTWVGIDGYSGPRDVLQAGCDADVQVSAGTPVTRYRAWYEWYPGNSSYIDNLPLAPGDNLSCVIQLTAGSTNSATIILFNQTKNIKKHFSITAPDGFALIGNSAEWILEANGQLGPLAQYGQVQFTDCQAVTAAGTVLTLASGAALNMVDSGNQIVSIGSILDPNSVQVANA